MRPWPGVALHCQVHPNQVPTWKAQLVERAAQVFSAGATEPPELSPVVKGLHAKIGQLGVENDFLSSALGRTGMPSVKRLNRYDLSLAGSGPVPTGLDRAQVRVYYQPRPIPGGDLRWMRRLDELHLEYLFFGCRRLLVKVRGKGDKPQPPPRDHGLLRGSVGGGAGPVRPA